MFGWVRDRESKRLIRSKLAPELQRKPEPELELKEMAQERPLRDIFNPRRTTLPSCFNLPNLGPNVAFELRPRYIQMIPKFIGLEDAYLFLMNLKKYLS